MTFSVQFNDSAIQARLTSMPERMRQELEATVNTLAQKLRSHVVSDKLLGQVLNRVTGRLGQSIQEKVESTATGVTGFVFSAGDVKYAAIHEYGGVITKQAHTVATYFKINSQGDFKQGFAKKKSSNFATTHEVGSYSFKMPERSYMRTSLADLKEEIINELKNAIIRGGQER